MDRRNLSAAIDGWNGKSVADIGAIYDSFHESDGFVEALLDCMNESPRAAGASWLLKHHLEEGVTLDKTENDELFKSLSRLQDWPSRLHVLQMLPSLTISESSKTVVERFVRENLSSDNKFVRAWAYNGFYELAKAHPQFRNECEQLMSMGLKDEPASVKARIRNAMKAGFPEAPEATCSRHGG